MKKEKFDFTKVLFRIVSLVVLATTLLTKENNMLITLSYVLVIIVLAVFDLKAPKIAKLSEDNPKIKTLRKLNRLNMFIVLICFLWKTLYTIDSPSYQETNQLIVLGGVSLGMMVLGNVSPKIPFNRYLGLRLPWTIRDEETWKIAHRVLGYLSFPLAILQIISSFFFSVEKVIGVFVIIWVIIPSLYSLWYFYKKFKNPKIC